MRYSLVDVDSEKVSRMPKNGKSLKTVIKRPIVYGQAVHRFGTDYYSDDAYYIYALELDKINKFEDRNMKELKADVVYIPSDSDLGRKLIDIVAPENKRTSVKYRGTYKVHDKECYCFSVKSFNMLRVFKKGRGDLISLTNIVTPEEIQELFPNLNHLFPLEMIQFEEWPQMLGQLKEAGLFYQQSSFSRGWSCKSLETTPKWIDSIYFRGLNFSYFDSYLTPTQEWERLNEGDLITRIVNRVYSLLSIISGLSYFPETKCSTHIDRLVCEYNNIHNKLPLSQLIADTMYITIMSKPERLLNLIQEFAPPQFEGSKYLEEIMAYVKYVITYDIDLSKESVRDFADTLIELNK